jgi:hypothetical protein
MGAVVGAAPFSTMAQRTLALRHGPGQDEGPEPCSLGAPTP